MQATDSKTLRICHVASGDLWAGAEVQIAGLLEELSAFPDLAVSAVLLNEGKLHDELSARNIPVAIYDERRLNSLQILSSLYSYFRNRRPQVLHTHRYKENILAGIAAKLSSVPVTVRTVHGLEEKLRGWEQAKINAYSRANAVVAKWTGQCIIAVSNEIASVLMKQFPKNPVVCVPNGINVGKVRPTIGCAAKRRELGISQDAMVVGTVSRLVPVKGIEFLLRAICILCSELPEMPVRLVVVGDGPMRSKLETLAKELNINRKTLFLGERTDVYDLMNTFDIYALPSLHEGIPMALLEAMALGRPVVASRVGGIPEVLTDTGEGKLVPAQNVEALSKALRELALSRQLRKRLGNAGRERIARLYESKKTASEVRDLYWRLAGERAEYTVDAGRVQKGQNERLA